MAEEGNRRYCPFCKRWLATLKEDGLFDLAGHASIFGRARADLADAVPAEGGGFMAPLVLDDGYEAECLRPLCRFRRWLRA